MLAILTAEPMTGYDLVRYFDGSVAFVWSAPHSQIYPELRRMEAEGLIEATEVPRGQKATKRIYAITPEGVDELRRWANDAYRIPPERDTSRLKAAYIEWGSYDAARRQLRAHRNHWNELLNQYNDLVDAIDSRDVPLLRRRLEIRPEAEHDAIVAAKRFAYRGFIHRAEAEIRWADEGLELVDKLESAGVPLTGQADDVRDSQTGSRRRGRARKS